MHDLTNPRDSNLLRDWMLPPKLAQKIAHSLAIHDRAHLTCHELMKLDIRSGRNQAGTKARVIDLCFRPGTKWCGSGNIAKDPDDLGTFAMTDACCREHDNCDDVIESMQTKHGLTNPAFYTR